ncbi:alpha-mannosidase [Fomitiporia mediterranea MF3/22]|uniref:alpha-mannosidase n=1 Tax=Fomitiporia mediterranea (strain MF3/22) TaxID=694068 RepID=UPI0004408EAA|nr:alpha-mannosidase [Fomitiporia mediterranea MF3/22]EJD01333.1 alpha-mannosidase [Fomitiporia mediterranea MF3/22]
MHWHRAWRQAALTVLLTGLEISKWSTSTGPVLYAHAKSWSSRRLLDAREKTRDLWNHGFNNYMENAFPYDELMPLSCAGRGPDWENPHNFANNDVAGNFSLTLIDVLDTFVVLGDTSGFEKAVRNTINWVSFDVNTRPQVFETTIRVLGGLLSGHIFASDPTGQFYLPWYRDELLILAKDLGQRLLPAFNTPTGIPYSRLNLRQGVPLGEPHDTCTAGAGSLILEFGTLSRLTGDDRFEKAAYKAFFALWNRKSDIGLVGNTINHFTGKWLIPEVTGIGAGVDSFYEYAFKWFVLSGEVEFLDVWHEAYAAVMRYVRGLDGFWFRQVNIHSGDAVYNTIDSLSAFWPGLQVIAGDIENAIKSHLIFWNLWKRHSGLPEVWDINFMQAVATQYPLRPEFVESTYYLYRATRDPFYLDVGERVLHDLILRSKVACGLAGIADLRINKRDDRMESFVLSETLKYLYLLFDEENPLHKDDSNYVFTTEGHILTLGKQHLKPLSRIRRKLRRVENLQCPVYEPVRVGAGADGENLGLTTGILFRPDVDYARALVGAAPTELEEEWYSEYGTCQVPTAELYSYDFVLSASGQLAEEDPSPSLQKLYEVSDGFILQNVTGIRTHIVSRLDGKGYDIVKLAQYPVRRGQTVYVNDSTLQLVALKNLSSMDEIYDNEGFPSGRPRDVPLRFSLDIEPALLVQPGVPEIEFKTIAFSASFGGDPIAQTRRVSGMGSGFGSRVTRVPSDRLGCEPYKRDTETAITDAVVLVHRGTCTFLEKFIHAKRAGARGVLVASDSDMPLNPSAEIVELEEFAGDSLDDAVIVAITQTAGEEISKLLDAAERLSGADLLVTVEPEGLPGKTDTQPSNDSTGKERTKPPDITRVLYLNGHPLLNTRLLI